MILFWMSLRVNFNNHKLFLPVFIATLITISVAGHYGSTLTHGDSFLTEYASAPPEEPTIEVVDSLRLYTNVVAKILDNKCVQCHNSSKQKGELSLLTPELILKGGVTGNNLVAGNASASLLYTRMLLPISDKEHMPPEGKAQLTKDEIWLVEHWINEGADFKNKVKGLADNNTLIEKLKNYLVFNKVTIPKAAATTIEKVRQAGFRIYPIVPNEAALNVKFTGKTIDKNVVAALSDIEEQIVELDFHTSDLTDDLTIDFNDFKNLNYLRINNSKITDKTLKNIDRLEGLEALNLFNTQITDQGLTQLLASIKPARIYTGNTKVSKKTATQLAATHDLFIQNNIADGFVEETQLDMPDITPAKTLFADTIHLNIKSKFKEVDLHYTLDNSVPDRSSPTIEDVLVLNNSTTLKVKAFKDGWLPSDVLTKTYAQVNDTVVDFKMKQAPDSRYPDPEKLFNLREGSLAFDDGNWVGYFGNHLETTVDLGTIKSINHISFNTIEDTRSWIFYPTSLTVYSSETKNGTYKKSGEIAITRSGQGGDPEGKKVTIELPNVKERFFKIKITNYGKLPEWHDSAGNPCWLFVDEIYFW